MRTDILNSDDLREVYVNVQALDDYILGKAREVYKAQLYLLNSDKKSYYPSRVIQKFQRDLKGRPLFDVILNVIPTPLEVTAELLKTDGPHVLQGYEKKRFLLKGKEYASDYLAYMEVSCE